MLKTRVLCRDIFLLKIAILFCQVSDAAVYRPAGSSSALITAIGAANSSLQDDIIDLGGFIYDYAVDCQASSSSSSCASDDYATFSAAALPFIQSGAGKLSIINGTIKRLAQVNGSPNTDFFRFFVVNSGADLSLFNITLEFGQLSGGPNDTGGAIYNLGNLAIENSSLVNNTVDGTRIGSNNVGGGAIYNNGIMDLENVIISGNTAINSAGGGIYGDDGGTANINNCTISNNTIVRIDDGFWSGGGLVNNGGITNISNSTISGNEASASAGGIFNFNVMSVINCTISGNTLPSNPFDRGGGIFHVGGSITISNNTIVDNVAGTGGGIYNQGTISSLISNIVAANTATLSAPDIFSSGTIVSEGFNLISSTTGNPIVDGVNNDIVVTDLTKLFLGPLQDNGGRTFTVALLSGSLAINNGNNPNALEFDQRGKPFKRVVCAVPDIGAYELQVCHTVEK